MNRIVCFLTLAIWAGAAAAQPAKSAKKPSLTAAQIMDRGAAVLGPKAAWDRIKTTVMAGTIEAKAQGLSGTVVVKAKRPGRFLVEQTIKGVGTTRQGYDGKVGWSKDPEQGLRKLTGAELSAAQRAAIGAHLEWRKYFAKWERAGTKKIGGRDAYVVRLSPKIGRMTIEYYDAKTFMPVRTDMVTEVAGLPVPIEIYPSDFRKVDGVLMPFKMRQRVLQSSGPVEVMVRIGSVKNNGPIPDTAFAMPKQ
ncbi:MAG: DUF620 domain-containing protein [Armatimonadetes bacterium]|nr:DUF620 domain-containing protein [Armatimonadota bacterium]